MKLFGIRITGLVCMAILFSFAACQSTPTASQDTANTSPAVTANNNEIANKSAEEKWERFKQVFSEGIRNIESGSYKMALDNFLEAAKLVPDDSVSYYNIACCYALLNNQQEALKWLAFSVEKGYDGNKESVMGDIDLDSIKGTREFVDIVNYLPDYSMFPATLYTRKLDPSASKKIGELYTAIKGLSAEQLQKAFIDVNNLKLVTYDEMINGVKDASIVYVGEQHDNPVHHALQRNVAESLYKIDPRVAVGMEQFESDDQAVLTQYTVDNTLTEEQYLAQANWANDWKMDYNLYKGIVDFCRENKLNLLGLNTPKSTVENVKKNGIKALASDEKTLVKDVYLLDERHKAFNVGLISQMHQTAANDSSYHVLCLWEESMAEAAVQFLKKNPYHKVVVVAGGGHIQYKFNIPQRAYKRLPLPYKTIAAQPVRNANEITLFHWWATDYADYMALTAPVENAMPSRRPYRQEQPEETEADVPTMEQINAQVAQVITVLEKVRELKFNTPVNVKVITREFANSQGIPPKIHGFYQHNDKALYIIQGANSRMLEGVWYHELVHALQDQAFDLSLLDKKFPDNADANMANTALVEGEALFTMAEAMVSMGDTQMKDYLDMPMPYSSEDSFKYFAGARFIRALKNKGGWEMVNKAFSTNVPLSTEHILHPEKYLAATDKPVDVVFPDLAQVLGKDWTPSPSSVMGEYGILRTFLANPDLKGSANAVAEGWAGDNIVRLTNLVELVELVIWKTSWDTENDAKEFYNANASLLSKELTGWTLTETNDSKTWTKGNLNTILCLNGKEVCVIRNTPEAVAQKILNAVK